MQDRDLKFKVGGKYLTRDGRVATIISISEPMKDFTWPIYADVEGVIIMMTSKGRDKDSDLDSEYDLVAYYEENTTEQIEKSVNDPTPAIQEIIEEANKQLNEPPKDHIISPVMREVIKDESEILSMKVEDLLNMSTRKRKATLAYINEYFKELAL